MKLNTKNFDICIVGYGPTGATLANLIAQCGLSVVVIEREPKIVSYTHLRAHET